MLKVGFDNPFRPFAWLEEGGPKGPLLARVAAILRAAGREFEFHPYELDANEPALVAGEVDLLAFKGITPQRSRVMAFSRPIFRSGAALFISPERTLAVHGDLARAGGRCVATPRRGPLAGLIAANYPGVRLLLTSGYDDALRAVAAGEADAAALNVHVGAWWVKQLGLGNLMPRSPFLDIDLAIATRPASAPALLAPIDAAIERLAGIEGPDRFLNELKEPS